MRTPAFYKHDASGKIVWPEDWTDVAALDYKNPALRRYMIGMLSYWIRDFDLDGFRCDVAGAVPVSFWNEARAALDKIKPDIIMMAEAHAPDLLAKAFDLDYSWPLHSKLTQVFEEGAPASELIKEWTEEKRIYPAGALHMRFSDNHDEKRAIARFGERGALAASAFVFTLDGVPLLYNGMEAGDTTESGAPALFEKLPVFWKIAERRPEFPRFYRQIIALRRAHPALQQGELRWVANSDPDRILSYIRRDADEELLVAINSSNRPFRGTIEGLETGDWSDITPPLVEGSHPEAAPRPTLPLTAWGYRVLRRAARSRSVDEL
jgi:cyclomaltodextrinase